MKLEFIDWEVEKEFDEDFWGYDHRYCLDERISKDESTGLCESKIILRTNDYCEIIQKIGELAFNNTIEFTNSRSLIVHRKEMIL